MNLPQAKIQLEKIISLYKSLSADEKNISSIERDLMLGYIRQLYETFLDIPAQAAPVVYSRSAAPPLQPAPKPEPPKPVYEPPRIVTPPSAPEPKPVVVEAPRPIAVAESPKPVYEPPRDVPPPAPKHTPPPAPVSYGNVSGEIISLFGEIEGKELSDRLSNAPVADLTKAFGLNDRLLTQNELFGGSKAVFDEAVKDLNNMSSFETAKGMLIDIATRNNWAATEDRKKQAKSFIKLVRRRFK